MSTTTPAASGPSSCGPMQAAENGTQPHHIEIGAADDAASNSRGSPRPIMVKPIVEKSPKSSSEWTLGFYVLDFGHGERGVFVPMPGALWRM